MRAKRKALHDKEAGKAKSAKQLPLATTPQNLHDGVKQEKFTHPENEGGLNGQISDGIDSAGTEIIQPVIQK